MTKRVWKPSSLTVSASVLCSLGIGCQPRRLTSSSLHFCQPKNGKLRMPVWMPRRAGTEGIDSG